ncbi:hypothetical protein ACTWP5_16645 [Streptomyces sp. 4N509B]|uniref:hypothetical protein n=1 Tax=Streptomyces sp. 4N509B TaxID=3457413 RepID=UPI003FD3A859
MPVKYEPPHELPARLLADADMVSACRERDFAQIFKLVKAKAGIYPSLIARRCDMTPSRVSEVLKGEREIRDLAVIERVADGLRIPGGMLGLAERPWESDAPTEPTGVHLVAGANLWVPQHGDHQTDPEFLRTLVEGQLPQHYTAANFFGARQAIPSALHQARSIMNALETASGSPREALIRIGSRLAEFLGWLFQDQGDFKASGFWSDRSMEWAQEAADDHMQSYVLFRKANQAIAQTNAQKAVGLARAAQRVPGITPKIAALAAQQEAQGYALMGNPKASLAKFDEAHSPAATPSEPAADGTLDTAYCTPTYIEIQRANCWIDLGEPLRAIQLLEAELAALPELYRNDRGVYLARLARAYIKAGEAERGAEAATKALAIVGQTGSARTMNELAAVARIARPCQSVPSVAAFSEFYQTALDRFAPGRPQGDERS